MHCLKVSFQKQLQSQYLNCTGLGKQGSSATLLFNTLKSINLFFSVYWDQLQAFWCELHVRPLLPLGRGGARGAPGAVAPSSGNVGPPPVEEKFPVCRGIFDERLCSNAKKDNLNSAI